MGMICQHESGPAEDGEITDQLPTLLNEEVKGDITKGWMEPDDISIASEGDALLKQDRAETLVSDPGSDDADEGDRSEGGQDELPQTEQPLLSETCAESLPLVVAVLGAKGLREADWLPGAHRYFHCVLRTCPRRQGRSTCQTRAVKDVVGAMNDVVDANWAEEDGIMEAQYVTGDSLEFDVVDSDDDGNSGLLGRAFLEAARFSERGFIGELPLEGAGAIFGTAATLSVEIMQPGQKRQSSNPKTATDSRDPIDSRVAKDPRSKLFSLIKKGSARPLNRRQLRAEAFARKRIW